jgi:hypothetical protein
MACCGQAQWSDRGASPYPVDRLVFGGFGAWGVPSIGTVASSVEGERAACCDACAVTASHEEEGASCGTGGCGVPQTAGLPLPLRGLLGGGTAAGVGRTSGAPVVARPAALSRAEGAAVDRYARAWAKATGVERGAGVVMPVASPGFRRSTLAEVRELSRSALEERVMELEDREVVTELTSEQGQELINLRAELVRRDASPEREGGGEGEEPEALSDAEWREKREAIARAAADQLEPGSDPASRARRDRIISQAVTGTFATFNAYLQREYDADIARIRGTTDIRLRELINEDRAAEREYRLALYGPGGLAPGGGGGSGGGGTAAVGLGLLGLLFAAARGG